VTPFGEAVRRIRQERGLTQKEMARGLGVSAAYLSALESGKRGKPGFDFLQRVAGYLNIIWDEADELFRVASLSHPRVVIDTTGLSADHTALANRLSQDIRSLSRQTVQELANILEQARNQREMRP
jgi:transcriptional regulator with XRE-family HTH domain